MNTPQNKAMPRLVSVPFDAHSSYVRGAADGPQAILDALASDSANLWTETGHDASALLNDVHPIPTPEPKTFSAALEAAATQCAESGRPPIFLGGDHSVTYPLVKGLRSVLGDFAILHFDAHPDCYDVFDDNPLSHACPFARIMEEGLCTRLVSVGVRTATGHQREQRKRFGIEWLEMKDKANWPTLEFYGPVYISLDMDVLDPAFAPGVAHHEPGGMSTREVLDVIHAVREPVVAADVVELNPSRDVDGRSAMTAAKLVREIAGLALGGDAR